MFAQRRTIWVSLALNILLALSIATGCGPGPEPTPTATSPPPQPTPTVTPTLAPVTLAMDVNPNVREIEAGVTVAIVARASTGEEASLTWSVEGTSGGRLSSETGDAVFYTAGNPGVDIVTAKGTTAKGAPVEERVSFNVVAAPTDTPIPPTDTPVPQTDTPVPPTDTPVPQTDTPVPPTDTPVLLTATPVPPTEAPTPIPTATPTPTPECRITKPADGDDDLGYENEVRATCSDVPGSLCISVLIYSHHDFKYYPQPGPISMGSGDYEGKAYLGWPTEGIGDEFDIIVALANETVSVKLRQDAESYSSYVTLPDGVEEKDRITVRRGH